MLYIVPTPIGNLKDITLRALEILKLADAIICEDTRRASILLNHYDISKTLLVLNDFNEAKKFPEIFVRLKNGENLALISDAGTPLVSDPGFKLVRECLKENIPVDSLPGATSVTVALTLSGLPPDKFLFLGFFPEKQGKRQEIFKKIRSLWEFLPLTVVTFVSPYKLIKTLEELKTEFGDINVVLAKELTKIHQSVQSKAISEHLKLLDSKKIKGEYILLIHPSE